MSVDYNAIAAQCPGCGAPLEFRVGSSRVIVCDHCQFSALRTDKGLESLGKVADLVPTGARLTLGARGRYQGAGFEVVGRVQLEWKQGVWDEWYATFEDGRFGWLAEAAGHYYFTFAISPRPVPRFEALWPGQKIFLPTTGQVVISDLKKARYLTARGELPEPIPVGEEVASADVAGQGGVFGTIDYADDPPHIYLGREVQFDDLRIDTEGLPPPKLQKVSAAKLICPKCRGPLELRAPDQTMRVTCPHCAALLDTAEGNLRILAELKRRQLAIPLGSKGTFHGVEYQAIGWLERECVVEDVSYDWEEFLLYDQERAAFRWLVCSEGHWSLVESISAGEVEEGPKAARYQGKLYKAFSSVTARVTGIVGELYWAVKLDESAVATDYVRPPEGLSCEATAQETNWSHAVYLSAEEVFQAFGLEKPESAARGIGSMQPNPHAKAMEKAGPTALYGLLAAVLLLMIFLVRAGEKVVYQAQLPSRDVAEASSGSGDTKETSFDTAGRSDFHAAAPSEPWTSVTGFSEPFVIENGRRNLEIQLASDVNNSWAFVSGTLINEDTGEADEFNLESAHYSGTDSDGAWTENNRDSSTFLSSLPAGRYTLRTEAGWEPGKRAPRITLTLVSGVARIAHFLWVALVVGLFPFVILWRYGAFEGRRWEESNLQPSSSSSEDDE